eukprot:scaffold183868_cov35-Tisochrysis_lutea.AAC.3
MERTSQHTWWASIRIDWKARAHEFRGAIDGDCCGQCHKRVDRKTTHKYNGERTSSVFRGPSAESAISATPGGSRDGLAVSALDAGPAERPDLVAASKRSTGTAAIAAGSARPKLSNRFFT